MTLAEARTLTRGAVLTYAPAGRPVRPATFVTLHSHQTSPGRYTTRALVVLDGRETSVRAADLTSA